MVHFQSGKPLQPDGAVVGQKITPRIFDLLAWESDGIFPFPGFPVSWRANGNGEQFAVESSVKPVELGFSGKALRITFSGGNAADLSAIFADRSDGKSTVPFTVPIDENIFCRKRDPVESEFRIFERIIIAAGTDGQDKFRDPCGKVRCGKSVLLEGIFCRTITEFTDPFLCEDTTQSPDSAFCVDFTRFVDFSLVPVFKTAVLRIKLFFTECHAVISIQCCIQDCMWFSFRFFDTGAARVFVIIDHFQCSGLRIVPDRVCPPAHRICIKMVGVDQIFRQQFHDPFEGMHGFRQIHHQFLRPERIFTGRQPEKVHKMRDQFPLRFCEEHFRHEEHIIS